MVIWVQPRRQPLHVDIVNVDLHLHAAVYFENFPMSFITNSTQNLSTTNGCIYMSKQLLLINCLHLFLHLTCSLTPFQPVYHFFLFLARISCWSWFQTIWHAIVAPFCHDAAFREIFFLPNLKLQQSRLEAMGAVLLTGKSAAAQFVKCAAILAIYYVRTPPYFGNIQHTYPSLFRQYTTYVPPSLQAAIIAIYNVPPVCYYWNILTKRPVMCAKFMCHQRGVRLWHCKERTEIECQCAKLHNIAMCQLCQCKPVWKHYHWPHMQGYAMWL